MYLFFDTETTGKIDYTYPVYHPQRVPRLVELAWILAQNGTDIVKEKSYLIKPEGYEIPESVIKIHGITNEMVNSTGSDLSYVLGEFLDDVANAEVVVSHNIFFDYPVLFNELKNTDSNRNFFGKLFACTMLTGTSVCKIETDRGYKWPKLTELYQYLFGETAIQTHRASADVKMCMKIFFKLRELGYFEINSYYIQRNNGLVKMDV
jgi:DNA polymerase III epsilon subunit-like protein